MRVDSFYQLYPKSQSLLASFLSKLNLDEQFIKDVSTMWKIAKFLIVGFETNQDKSIKALMRKCSQDWAQNKEYVVNSLFENIYLNSPIDDFNQFKNQVQTYLRIFAPQLENSSETIQYTLNDTKDTNIYQFIIYGNPKSGKSSNINKITDQIVNQQRKDFYVQNISY